MTGESLVLRHYRPKEGDRDKLEELAPIDQNLNYNVDYQVNMVGHVLTV